MTVSFPQDSNKRKVELCGGAEAYNERSLCVKYLNQGVQTLFYESTPSTQDPLGNKISSGARRNSGHVGTNIPYKCSRRMW